MTKPRVKIINGSVRLPACYICAFEGIIEKLEIDINVMPDREYPKTRAGEASVLYGRAWMAYSINGARMKVFKNSWFGRWHDYTDCLNNVAALNAPITKEQDYI